MTNALLIIFVKNPVLGKVKTRLAATLGDERALKVYLKLLEYTAKVTNNLPVERAVFYSDSVDTGDLWDNSTYLKQLQSPGDLGERMQSAFDWGFESGHNDICIIGSDCYELTPEIIMSGFQTLSTHDAVLGPSRDGGYYLLGMKKMREELFQNKNWGTDSVATETIDDLQRIGLSCRLIETLNDIDVESDLGDYGL